MERKSRGEPHSINSGLKSKTRNQLTVKRNQVEWLAGYSIFCLVTMIRE